MSRLIKSSTMNNLFNWAQVLERLTTVHTSALLLPSPWLAFKLSVSITCAIHSIFIFMTFASWGHLDHRLERYNYPTCSPNKQLHLVLWFYGEWLFLVRTSCDRSFELSRLIQTVWPTSYFNLFFCSYFFFPSLSLLLLQQRRMSFQVVLTIHFRELSLVF